MGSPKPSHVGARLVRERRLGRAANPFTTRVLSDAGMSDPSVSVIVPVRNEASFVEATVSALLDQVDLPPEYEVLVVDGMSDDGTRDVARSLAQKDQRVRLIDNPAGTVPTALNLGIRASNGDIIIRVDGHTTVARDFVRANLELLAEHPEAWSVGGPIAHRGKTPIAKA